MAKPFNRPVRLADESDVIWSEAPVSGPTLVEFDNTTFAVGGATRGMSLGTAELTSGAEVLTILLFADSFSGRSGGFGLCHHLTIDAARTLMATLDRLCTDAEANAAMLATAVIDKARGR